MENEFVTFERLANQEAALAMGRLLEEHGIDYRIEDQAAGTDAMFTPGAQREIRIKLRKEDFKRVEGILEEMVLGDVEALQGEHYLFRFSDDELIEVVANRDEWSPFDFMLARRILRERGKELSDETLSEMRKARLAELAQPAKHQRGAIVAGYIFAVLGGVLGIFIGWYLYSHQKTLPDGEMVYAHCERDRRSGKRILALSIILLLFWIGFRFVYLAD